MAEQLGINCLENTRKKTWKIVQRRPDNSFSTYILSPKPISIPEPCGLFNSVLSGVILSSFVRDRLMLEPIKWILDDVHIEFHYGLKQWTHLIDDNKVFCL